MPSDTTERLRLATIFSSTLVSVAGVSMVSPLLAELRAVFGVSDVGTSLFIAAYTVPGIVLVSVVGVLADRIGRRRVLAPLLAVHGVSGVAIVLTTDFRVALALRVLQGIGASGLITLSITVIGDHYRGDRARTLVGLNSGLIAFGAAAFPVLGGALGTVDWRLPFLAFGVALPVSFASLFTLESTAPVSRRGLWAHLGDVAASLHDRTVIGLYAAAFVAFVALYGGILTVIPLLLRDRFGFGPAAIGVLLAVTALSNAVIAGQQGWLGDRLSRTTALELGLLGLGGALLGLSVAGSIAAVGVLLAVFGVGVGLTMPTVDAALTSIAPAHLRGSLMAGKSTLVWLGQTTGPILFTAVGTAGFGPPPGGYLQLYAVVGMCVVCFGVLSPLLVSDRRSPP